MTIEARFLAFHAANPQVYEEFKRFAFQAIAHGASSLSSKFILERVRWESMITTHGGGFKINNDFTSRYARLFAKDFPAHADKFEFREVVTL